MVKKLLAAVLILFFVFGNTVFAQKEHYVWYFGDSAGIDFNSGVPVALTNGVLYTGEGCSSISDANGNLLFYTNGVTVWDSSHSQMPNGDLLAGGSSSTQSSLIVPFPGNNFLYYIFTVGEMEFPPIDFDYSIVDMTLNNGKGDVTVKNNSITSLVSEKLTAVKHFNGTDIWVMVHGEGNNNFYCYLVTASGISTNPVTSSIGPVLATGGWDIIGYMRFSPDGTKIAYAATENNYVDLFDFNLATGIVSNEKYLNLPPLTRVNGVYGLEFSRSGNYLYTSLNAPGFIYQWDISSNIASLINASIQQIDSGPFGQYFGALQGGPDGKIYFSYRTRQYLGAINNPELPGVLCNFDDSVVALNGKACVFGLPNFMTSYFLPTGINTNNPEQNQLTISPNPATDKIYISFSATASEDITTKIFSITGEVVYEQKNKSAGPITQFQIPIFNISNGIYFLSVQTEKQFITKKIAVQH